MARLLTSGAEWNDATAEGVTLASSMTIATTKPRTGTYGYQSPVAGGGSIAYSFTGATAVTYYARAAYWLPAYPGAANSVLSFTTAGGATIFARVVVNFDGTVELQDSSTARVGSVGPVVGTGAWFVLELAVKVNTSTNDDYAEARLNGVAFASSSALNIGTTAPAQMNLGTPSSGSPGQGWIDDLALNDSSGAAQNSWPGDGKVVLLKPISDSAIGTGWTLGTGTAISANSGSTAVKNTPPVGVADLTAGSDTKQIRNASSNANVNYDANLTTYTTAGIGASDTVNVLVPMVATGAPVVTSAKAGTIGISTNPAIANIALGAGGTAGAFWSGVAAGTYPTGWKWSFGTTTYAPTVTLGSSPIARITQVTASTRIADVCAMGMYVDYTPAVVAVTTPPRPTVVLQAVNRAAIW